MLEAGRYKARGVEAALGVAKTGTEQIAVLVEVTEGPDAGAQITWYGFFTEKTTERTLESLRHLGWEGDDLTELDGITANVVSIVVEHEEDQRTGEPRARVKWINGPGGLAMKDRMDPGTAKAFAQRMKGAAVASRGGAAPRPAGNGRPQQHRQTRAPAPEVGDDDIPF
jgi:hypothetical protein